MSAAEYITIINGKASKPMSYDDAIGRGDYHGRHLGKTVEVHRLRNGKTDKLVASWHNWKRTK